MFSRNPGKTRAIDTCGQGRAALRGLESGAKLAAEGFLDLILEGRYGPFGIQSALRRLAVWLFALFWRDLLQRRRRGVSGFAIF
jgi:hypothetical protein